MNAESTSVSFKYDCNGLRTQKVVEQDWYPEITNYTYHGKLLTHMTVDYTDFDEVARQDKLHFFYDEQNRPAKVEFNETMSTYLHNVQGDVAGLLDSAGILMIEYKYDAWDKLLSTTGTLAGTLGKCNPFRYRGYVYDGETGLCHVSSRYYDPEVGRFINAADPDVLGVDQGNLLQYSLFAYCLNNPVNRLGGKVNLVITKDLSRLSRDYIQTGYYTDVYFRRKRVRYIAVNDGIDTSRDDNDIAPFKNILNDNMYAKDLSRKVKSAKRQRAYKGTISAHKPPTVTR